MTEFLFIGLLSGAILGMRCKVIILVPATLISLAAIVFSGLLLGSTTWEMALATIVTTTAVDVGYLLTSAAGLLFSARKHTQTSNLLKLPSVAYYR